MADTLQLLAFDFGTQKIGVASGQQLTGSTTPLERLRVRNQQINWQAIQQLLDEWRPDLVLVGLPLNMDGTESPMSQRCRRFARQLEGRFHCNTQLIDERLSSRSARERLGVNQDPRVDSMAAVIMIETYLHEQSAG